MNPPMAKTGVGLEMHIVSIDVCAVVLKFVEVSDVY